MDVADEGQPILTLWLVIGVGCMDIWPITTLAPKHNRLVVVVLAPLKVRSNLGSQAHREDVAEGDKFILGA